MLKGISDIVVHWLYTEAKLTPNEPMTSYSYFLQGFVSSKVAHSATTKGSGVYKHECQKSALEELYNQTVEEAFNQLRRFGTELN